MASYHKMAWGINLNQSVSEWNGTTLYPQGSRNSRVHHWQKKLWLIFWGERGVILVIIWPLYWHSKKSECSPLLSYPTRKMSELLLLYKTARPQKCPYHWGHQKVWMKSLTVSTLQLWPCTIRFSPFTYLKDSHWGPHYPDEEALQNGILKWLQREENNFHWAGMHTLVEKWRRKVTKMDAVLKNNCAFNTVVNFCEIFTCLMFSVACSKK